MKKKSSFIFLSFVGLFCLNAFADSFEKLPNQSQVLEQQQKHRSKCVDAYQGNHGNIAVLGFLNAEHLVAENNKLDDYDFVRTAISLSYSGIESAIQSLSTYGTQKNQQYVMDYPARHAILDVLYDRAAKEAGKSDELSRRFKNFSYQPYNVYSQSFYGDRLKEKRVVLEQILNLIKVFEDYQMDEERNGNFICPTQESENI